MFWYFFLFLLKTLTYYVKNDIINIIFCITKGDKHMALWKIFLLVVVAILFSTILIKHWRVIAIVVGEILLAVVFMTTYVVVSVLTLPRRLLYKLLGIDSEERIRTNMVKQYDYIFYQADSKKKVARMVQNIELAEMALKECKRQKEEKEIKKLLRKCKWVL